MKRVLSAAVGFCLFVPFLLAPVGAARAQGTPRGAARLVHELEDHGAPQLFSPDGKTLALRREKVHLYDVASGEVRAAVGVLPESAPARAFFTPDGKSFVVHTDIVRVFNADDGKLVREFAEGTSPANLYNRIHTGSEAMDASGSPTYTPPSNKENLEELPALEPGDRVLSPDQKSMLARAESGVVAVYDFATGEQKFTLKPAHPPAGEAGLLLNVLGEFSPDGKLILTTHADPVPRLWDAATGKLVADLAPHPATVYGARFSPDGKFIVTTSTDGVVKTWDGATGKLLQRVRSADDPTYFAAWSPRSDTFVTKSRKWEVEIWDAATGKQVARLDHKAVKEKFDQNLTFVYSPDGRRLLTRARNVDTFLSIISPKKKRRYIAHVWDTATGKLVASLRDTRSHDGVEYEGNTYLWSRGGSLIVTAGPSVKVWRASGELVQELEGNAHLGAVLSRDGTLLAAVHAPTIGLKDVLKLFIGKPPKDTPFITRVWKLEEDAATISANK